MSQKLEQSVARVVGRIVGVIAEDAELRRELSNLARMLLKGLDEEEPTPETEAQTAAQAEAQTEAQAPAGGEPVTSPAEGEEKNASPRLPTPPKPAPQVTPLPSSPPREQEPAPSLVYSTDPQLTTDHAPRVGAMQSGMPDLEILREIQGKCAVKAEACHWALERMNLRMDGADLELEIRPRDREVQEKANVFDSCYLWMSGLFSPTPETAELWVNLAENFQGLASITEVLQDVLTHTDVSNVVLEESVDLAAEVQSALRIAVQDVGQRYDPDQVAFFRWLRQFANVQQIFIQRHMRESDPADPGAWADMQERVAQLDEKRQAARNLEKRRKNLMGKVRYHAGKVAKAEGTADDSDWMRIAESIDALVADGLAPSNKDLRNCLLPIMDDLPDLEQDTPGLGLVLREIDRYLSCAPAVGGGPPERIPAPEVEEARSLLAGKTLVIIGGEERPEARASLEDQLALKEAIWVPGNHHQSVLEFKPYVEREDVHLVCLLIKWSSHGFGDVKNFCDACNKPLVRLPGGYSPNQVAHHVVTQAGKRLRAGAETDAE